MARHKVEQVRCDRCKRVELQAVLPEPRKEPTFTCRLDAKVLSYEDLCSFCRSLVERLMDQMEQWERELQQQFGPAVSNNTAAPVVSAPNYTPQQPHSGAAAKKV